LYFVDECTLKGVSTSTHPVVLKVFYAILVNIDFLYVF